MSVGDEKETVTPEGAPLAESLAEDVNPGMGTRDTLREFGFPWTTARLEALELREKPAVAASVQ